MVSMHAVVELSSSMNTTATQTVDNKSMTIVLAVTLFTIATLLVLLIALVCFVVKTVVKGKRAERNATAGLPDGAYSHLNRSQQSSVSSFSREQSGDINGNKYTTTPNTERSASSYCTQGAWTLFGIRAAAMGELVDI